VNRVPEACTLPVVEQPARLAEFDSLLGLTLHRPERPDRQLLRLHLSDDDTLRPRIRDLITRESACCSFFGFDLARVDGTTRLELHVPPTHTAVLDALQQRAVELSRRTRT
jgi:hypothetical protein